MEGSVLWMDDIAIWKLLRVCGPTSHTTVRLYAAPCERDHFCDQRERPGA